MATPQILDAAKAGEGSILHEPGHRAGGTEAVKWLFV